jgi:hypothetical protein
MFISMLRIGIPHLCSSDDEYDGYLIPKGTLVFGSVWYVTSGSLGPGELTANRQM